MNPSAAVMLAVDSSLIPALLFDDVWRQGRNDFIHIVFYMDI